MGSWSIQHQRCVKFKNWALRTALFIVLGFSNMHTCLAQELATYMGELQRLTHKLQLSLDHKNHDLSEFYLHESLALLQTIQNKTPVYEDLPIAVFVDRFAYPSYASVKNLLKNKSGKDEKWESAGEEIIKACNQCHQATKHGFIRIQKTYINPFNQDFSR